MMAKFILFHLGLALLTASNSKIGGAAAADTVHNQQQWPMPMAEQLRLYSSPKWLDAMAQLFPQISNVVHQSASFYKREVGPLGPIFRAISKMPEKSTADVRSKEETFGAAMELMKGHFGQLLVPLGGGSARTAYDDNLARRRQAMAELVGLSARHKSTPMDAHTANRLVLFVRRELGPLFDILLAIRRMPENSYGDVHIKNEAFDAAMDLLDRKFELLTPHHGGPYAVFAVGKMPETTLAEVRCKEEARAAAREMIHRYLDKLVPGVFIKVKIHDDL